MKKTLGIVAALLVGVGGALWIVRDGAPSTPTPVVAQRASPARDLAPTATDTGAAARGTAPAEIEAAMSPESDLGAAALARTMAETAYERVGSRVVDYLANQGLARVDGERIAAELLNDLAICAFDALREQALAEGVAYGTVLDAMEAELHDADGPLLVALVDLTAVGFRATPCATNVLQQAGVSPSAALDALGLVRPEAR